MVSQVLHIVIFINFNYFFFSLNAAEELTISARTSGCLRCAVPGLEGSSHIFLGPIFSPAPYLEGSPIFSSAFAHCVAAHQEAGPEIPNTYIIPNTYMYIIQHINRVFLDRFRCCYPFFLVRGERFHPEPPLNHRGGFGTSWSSSGMLKKPEEIFQDRRGGKKINHQQLTSCRLEVTDWGDVIRQDSKMPG